MEYIEIWRWGLTVVIILIALNALRLIWFSPKKPWIRFIYENEWVEIVGPWVRHDQEKIDAIFEMYEELGRREIDFVHVNDKRGNEIIIPGQVISQTIVTIQTKNRYF